MEVTKSHCRYGDVQYGLDTIINLLSKCLPKQESENMQNSKITPNYYELTPDLTERLISIQITTVFFLRREISLIYYVLAVIHIRGQGRGGNPGNGHTPHTRVE